jgi:hypothetical protein
MRKEKNVLFTGLISKPIPRMENAKIIHILHIAFLEIQSGTVLFRQEVQSIERLGLRFRDRGDILRPGLSQESSEVPPRVLNQDPLRGSGSGRLVV